MATKTISISEEAYRRLAALKKENDSFSIVINRLTRKKSLLDLFGVLSKEEGDRLEQSIKEVREWHRKAEEAKRKEYG